MSTNIWIIIGIIALVIVVLAALLIGGIAARRSPKLGVLRVQQPTRVVQYQQPAVQMIPVQTQVQPRYIELVGQDHVGSDILFRGDLADNIPALETLCNETPGCVGFNNGGFLKSQAQPTTPSNYNFYVLQ